MLTIVSISVSLCLLGVLMAIYYAFYFTQASPSQALRLVVRNKISLAVPMPLYYRDKIRQVSGVREIAPYQWFGGVYKDRREAKNMFPRFAVEPDKILTVRGEISPLTDLRPRNADLERLAGLSGNTAGAAARKPRSATMPRSTPHTLPSRNARIATIAPVWRRRRPWRRSDRLWCGGGTSAAPNRATTPVSAVPGLSGWSAAACLACRPAS
jgi:hypothetical protein